MNLSRRVRSLFALAGLLSLAGAQTALADTTIRLLLKSESAYELVKDGSSTQQKGSTSNDLTIFTRNGDIRSETSNGVYSIYKAAQKKLFVIDPAAKTYYVLTRAELMSPRPPKDWNPVGKLDSKVDIDLLPTTTRQSVGDTDADVIAISGRLVLTQEVTNSSSSSIGVPGLLSFPLSEIGHIFRSSTTQTAILHRTEYEISGELFAKKKPRGSDLSAELLCGISSVTPMPSAMLHFVLSEINNGGYWPVGMRLTSYSLAANGAKSSVTVNTEVKSIEKSNLDPKLFDIPIGFVRVSSGQTVRF